MSSFGTVVVATDLSDPSLTALGQAVKVAHASASLILVYVAEDRLPPLIVAAPSEIATMTEGHCERARQKLGDVAEKFLPGKSVEIVVRSGVAHEQIVQVAKERNAEVLVIGTHGHGLLKHMAGSTAERVLHHAPCPVLVVPHR